MKKLAFAFLVLLLSSSLIMAQSQAKESTEKKEEKEAVIESVSGPHLTFESLVVDYGDIEKGSDPLRKFVFLNDGTEPLVIKNAKGSCGCTVPDYPKEPIFPGEPGTIDVRYDTNRIGQFTKTVTLTTNMGEDKIVLTIKGKVSEKVEEESVPTKEGSIF